MVASLALYQILQKILVYVASGFYFTRNLLKNCNIAYIRLFSKKHEKKVVKVSFLDTQNQTFLFYTDPNWIFIYKVTFPYLVISKQCNVNS